MTELRKGNRMISFDQFVNIVEKAAPLSCAYEWDNSGVQAHIHDDVEKVLVCLDLTRETLREALEKGCDTILTHHPVIFRAIKSFRKDDPMTGVLAEAVGKGMNIYSAHTSYDCAPGGINDLLARQIGLINTKRFADVAELSGKMAQVVVFAPQDCEEAVKRAMSEAGAGRLGDYSAAAFTAKGIGEFTPESGANPHIGKVGAHETVSEARIEMICPMEKARSVVSAIKNAHSYEEPSIQVYPLSFPLSEIGLGVVGETEREMTLRELAEAVKERTGGFVRISRLPADVMNSKVTKVAQIGGAGGEFSALAKAMGCCALVTGEAKYNHFIDAENHGVLLIEAGHFDTEICFVDGIINTLQKEADMLKWNLTLFPSERGVRPYDVI